MNEQLPAEYQERITRLFLRDIHEPHRPVRRWSVAGCPTCALEGHPPHDASRHCDSGGYNHCSCEACF